MKSFNFWRSLFFSALAVVAFGACSDDDDKNNGDAEASITVNGDAAVTLGVRAEAGTTEAVTVLSSGAWTLAFEAEQDWLTSSATSGNGGTSTLTFAYTALPEGAEVRRATAVLSTQGVIFGTSYTETARITVEQSASGEVTETVLIYKETFGTAQVSGNTDVAQYTAWNKTGEGAAGVTYAGTNVSVRNSSPNNSNSYEGASGAPILFFGKNPATFTVQNIALAAGQTRLQLTFGGQQTINYDNKDYTWSNANLLVALSADGEVWSTIEYTTSDGDQSAEGKNWVLATADFTLTAPAERLYIRFTSPVLSSNLRIDDITLQTGMGGQQVDLTQGDPEPVVEYTEISSVNALGEGKYKLDGATIVGVHSKGVMFGDATGYVLAFNNAWATQDANPYKTDLDKTATVKGTSALRYGLYQFTDFEVTVGEASSFTLPDPVTFDAAAIKAYADAIKADESAAAYKYVDLMGVLNIVTGSNYNTYTLDVAGLEGITVQFAYGLDSYFAGLASGDAVDAKGFALGFDTSNNKLNVLLRSIEKNTTVPTVSFTSEPAIFAAENPEEQTINFTAQNLPDGTEVAFDFAGDDRDKFAVVSQIATTVTIKAVGDNTSEAAYTATLTASVGTDVLDQVDVKQAAPVVGDTWVSADFSSLHNSTSYGTVTADGWEGVNVAVQSGGTNDSNPVFKSLLGESASTKGMVINGKTTTVGVITSPVLTNGCGTLMFDYGITFGETAPINFKVEIKQDGTVVKTFTVNQASPVKFQKYTFNETVNVTGALQIVITNNCPANNSTGNKDRYTIFNIKWTENK